jgi:hypothetical protein
MQAMSVAWPTSLLNSPRWALLHIFPAFSTSPRTWGTYSQESFGGRVRREGGYLFPRIIDFQLARIKGIQFRDCHMIHRQSPFNQNRPKSGGTSFIGTHDINTPQRLHRTQSPNDNSLGSHSQHPQRKRNSNNNRQSLGNSRHSKTNPNRTHLQPMPPLHHPNHHNHPDDHKTHIRKLFPQVIHALLQRGLGF